MCPKKWGYGIIDDPIRNNCEEGPETATHYLCECSRDMLRLDMIFGEKFRYGVGVGSCEIHSKITGILTTYKSLVYH